MTLLAKITLAAALLSRIAIPFGAFAAGVGTTDLEVGILKGVCAFRAPKSLKVEVVGTLPKGVVAKDIILNVIKQLTVNGGTDMVIEFCGPVPVDDHRSVGVADEAERNLLCEEMQQCGFDIDQIGQVVVVSVGIVEKSALLEQEPPGVR